MIHDFVAYLDQYPYLGTEIIGLVGFCAALALAGAQRRTTIFAGLMLVPFAFLAPLHAQTYWHPERFLGGDFGLEDAIYLFLGGSVSWAIAARISSFPTIDDMDWRRFGVRGVTLTTLTSALWFGLGVVGLSPFSGSIVALSCVILLLAQLRPERAGAALSAAVGFAAYHVANLAIAQSIWPDFQETWLPGSTWTETIASIPVGEIAFSLVFGAAHPLGLAWLLEPPAGRANR